MNRFFLKSSVAGLVLFTVSYSQIDFKADVINFRDATKTGTTTVHYGKFDINSSTHGVYSNHTGTQALDYVAVYGRSVPIQYYGIGGSFEGGYIGVLGQSSITGSGSRYGGHFIANASPSTGNTLINYGVYTQTYSGTYNYGVYSYAPNAENSYAGYFDGNVFISGTLTNPSDERLKENIKDLNNSLPIILRLKPKTYNYVESNNQKLGLPKGKRVGLIAQDVEDVLPDLVKEIAEPLPAGEKNTTTSKVKTFKSVDYLSLIPVLIGAIQEQQKQIDMLTAELKKVNNNY